MLRVLIAEDEDIIVQGIMDAFFYGIEMIREASKTVKFRSIILTSYAEFDYAKRAISAHVDEFLLKPVNERELGELLHRLATEIAGDRQADHGVELNLDHYAKKDLSENHYVAKTIEKIRKDYASRLNIEGISEELGVSASYLSRRFKEVTGQTFLDFLNKYRVQMAIAMLSTGQYRVYEISEATGFTDYKHFCSVFKKYTLKSPTHFAKRIVN